MFVPFGWKVVGNRRVEWQPLSDGEQRVALPEGAKWLRPEQLPELGRIDRQHLLSQLEKPSAPNDTIRFCVDDPEATSWRWLIKRSNFYATTLLPESAPKPSHFALLLPSATGIEEEASYAVWMFDHVERKVAVLRLRFTSATAFAQLVGTVRQQAAEFGMHKCVAWNVDLASLGVQLTKEDQDALQEGAKVDRFKEALHGGVVVERKGKGTSLPALAWYGDKQQGERVEWVCDEYGWWC